MIRCDTMRGASQTPAACTCGRRWAARAPAPRGSRHIWQATSATELSNEQRGHATKPSRLVGGATCAAAARFSATGGAGAWGKTRGSEWVRVCGRGIVCSGCLCRARARGPTWMSTRSPGRTCRGSTTVSSRRSSCTCRTTAKRCQAAERRAAGVWRTHLELARGGYLQGHVDQVQLVARWGGVGRR